MKVHITPQPPDYPKSGGVREHLFQLHKFMSRDQRVELVSDPNLADILHVESAFPFPNGVDKPSVYVCHGGFVPTPLRVVTMNLTKATKVVSVASWIIYRFFSQHAHKTSVIPNGVDLDEFKDIPGSNLEPGYILYGKDYDWNFQHFYSLIEAFPDEHFVSTFWPSTREYPMPRNATYIGQQKRTMMRSVIDGCKFLVLTGSEVCPTMMLEAWACGKPVLAADLDGNEELMTRAGHKNGLYLGGMLYKPDDMISKFERFLASKKLEPAGIPGIRKLVEQYDWNFLCDLYVGVYERLLA